MNSSKTRDVLRDPTRRTLLKSVGMLVGASALASSMPVGATNMSAESTTSSGLGSATPPIHKPMVGFMLAHAQFPVPKLVQFGVSAEQAGFDLLATSDHFQPWQANERHSGEARVPMAAFGERN